MSGGFEEWSTARTPSLLAFASALAEDEQHADAAVMRALVRINRTWERVCRDDPDLEARRLVVRACSTPRRGAAVLRALEDRTDAEIAEILGCSESAARRHVQRGLADADQHRPARADSVRDELMARAGSAPTQLLTRPPATHPREQPPRRRRGAWLAALAVVALVGGVAYVSHESRTPNGLISYPRVDVPHTWRYESYAGVQLRVPDTWGWGGSPVRSSIFSGPRHLGSCGTDQAAVLSPRDHSAYVSTLTQFVGRPAILTDRCMSWGSAGTMPTGEAVWFDSPLAVGVKPVGSTVAETRAVGDQKVTVFGSKPTMRREILGTAEQVDVDGNGCPTRAISRPTAGPTALEPVGLSVCVYSQDTGVATLLYSGVLPQANARAYAAHVGAGLGRTSSSVCATPSGQWVAMGLHAASGTRWDIANLSCDRIEVAGGRTAVLSASTVRDWASGGVTAYVGAPRGGDRALDEYFRAPTG